MQDSSTGGAPARRRPDTRTPTERAWGVLSPRRYGRFLCHGCGLLFPRRRAVDPHDAVPSCLCCWLLASLPNAELREALRAGIERHDLRRRVMGGRDSD